MTTTIIWTIVAVTLLGLLLAVVLFLVAKKFKVEEDPRIDEVEKVMPGAIAEAAGLPAAVLLLRHVSMLRIWTTTSVLSAAMK